MSRSGAPPLAPRHIVPGKRWPNGPTRTRYSITAAQNSTETMLNKTSSASLDRSVIFQPQNKPSEVESSSVYIIVCPAALVLDRKKLAAFSAAAGLAKTLVATNSPGESTQYSSGKHPIC